jgi:hypothetical protein
MNTNKLLSVLRDIRLLKFVSEAELQKLADDYPYFQQAHILLAKKYLFDNNPDFEDKLHKAAIYASDRTNLRAMMDGSETKEIIRELHSNTIAAETATENKVVIEEELSHASMSDMLPSQDTLLEEENQETVIEENTATEATAMEEPEEVSLPSETVKEDELSYASMSDMLPPQDTLLEEENYDAVTNENTITEAEALEELEEASLPSEAAKEDELSHASMSDMLPQQDTLLEEENYEVLAEEDTVTEATAMEELEAVATPPQSNGKSVTEGFNINQPHTFSDWLKFIENSPRALLNKSSAPDYHPISVPDPPANQPVQDTLIIIEHIPDILIAEPTDNLQAIDEFVAETAHVSDSAKEIPVKVLADKSLEENDELLTETLARIYEEQGLYNKAIRVYAKLSLKFPKKSVYFASLIKDLKSKI